MNDCSGWQVEMGPVALTKVEGQGGMWMGHWKHQLGLSFCN